MVGLEEQTASGVVDWAPIVDWFGFRHDLHDAELLSIDLNHLTGSAIIRLHAFRMTPEVDAQGFYVLDRHAIVSFLLEGIVSVSIGKWEYTKILDRVESDDVEGFVRLVLSSVMDAEGHSAFVAEKITIEVAPFAH